MVAVHEVRAATEPPLKIGTTATSRWYLVAAHVREHSLTLVLQQSALNTGVLAPEMASGHAVTVFARDRDTPWGSC